MKHLLFEKWCVKFTNNLILTNQSINILSTKIHITVYYNWKVMFFFFLFLHYFRVCISGIQEWGNLIR